MYIIELSFWAEKSIFPEYAKRIDPDHIRHTWTGQEMTTFREFLASSTHFGQKGGWKGSAESEFFCAVIHATFRQLCNGRFSPNLATKRSSVSRR